MSTASITDFTKPSDWFPNVNYPLIIAGPCSAESEEQVLSTANSISKITGVSVFRAGVWKPRTRPNSFQGHGNEALKWLSKVKEQTGLLTTVEVASPKHIEASLKYGIDILWIGARTTVSPFLIEEIAASLSGTDIPVLIKNPINPDINLWIGAIERFYAAGIKKIAAIHRGFNTYEKTPYRNHPIWDIPIELKRQYPNLPLLCDPSHIAGHTEFIEGISQKALDLDYDGLMIETHIDPTNAISDAEQQLSVLQLSTLLKNLSYRQSSKSIPYDYQLEELRRQIDDIDNALLNLLKKRMAIVGHIGNYKKLNNIAVLQIRRWDTIMHERMKLGLKLGLDKDFIEKMLKIVHEASIQLQHKIMSK